jgi:hypothetical protein
MSTSREVHTAFKTVGEVRHGGAGLVTLTQTYDGLGAVVRRSWSVFAAWNCWWDY